MRTFDLHQADGLVLLPMELVDGGSLRDAMQSALLPIDDVIRLTAEILEALAVLHGLGILHRDLKPANLLLTADGNVKLSDFGLARRWTAPDESRLTSTGAPLGTLDYISPEQALGEDVDPRTDLYSLGVILFEMLTGKLPFHATSAIGAVMRRFKERPPNVRSLRPDTPRWLAALVERLLTTDREGRYASAQAVLADLRTCKVRGTRRRWMWIGPAVAAAAIAIIAAAVWLRWREPSRLVTDGDWGVRMLDRRGRVLWSRPDTRADKAAFARWWRFGRREVAAVLMTPDSADDPSRVFTLAFLDPRTSRILRTRRLPNAFHAFPGFANRWGVYQVLATDLNGDGANEVIVTYVHMFYPSFVVLHDLGRDESRVIFLAHGHHTIRAVHDLDGDGTKELLLAGVSNKLGWNTGVAAIRVPLDQPGEPLTASTPDRPDPSNGQTLAWYALAPPGDLHPLISVAGGRDLLVHYRTGATYLLGFDGFPPESRSALGPADRAASRRQAYAELRDVMRLTHRGDYDTAIRKGSRAKELAQKASDGPLTEWIDRVTARTLAFAGRIDDADRKFTAIHGRAMAPSDVAYDAGLAFHLAGELPLAVEWYRQGLGGDPSIGRLRYEHALGIVLALGERKKWTEALEEINAFAAAYPEQVRHAQWLRAYVAWRSDAALPAIESEPGDVDYCRYWAIELALARGVDPQQVLWRIDDEIPHSSELGALLSSVQSEALRRLGRRSEALKYARDAYGRTVASLHRDQGYARAHFDLVAERLARIADEHGLTAEAAEARETAAKVRWRAIGMQAGTNALPRRAVSP